MSVPFNSQMLLCQHKCSDLVFSLPVCQRVMGKGSRSGKPSGSGASKVTKQSTAKAPDPGLRLPKFLLAPYVSKDGCPFYLKGAASEHALLSLENIAASRSYHNSEWARGRLGIAVSESAGVTQMGAPTFLKYLRPDKVVAALEKMKFQELVALLDSADGQQFLEAVKTLNRRNEQKVNEEELKSAVKQWHGFLSSHHKTLEKRFQKLAQLSARLYLWAADSLEQLAIVQKPRAVAAQIPESGRRLKAVKEWVKKPSDTKQFRKAVVACYLAQISGPATKTTLSESDPNDEATKVQESESSSSSSSSSEPKKKSKKKSKKGSSSSDPKASKDPKKAKKDEDGKKKKTKRSSSETKKAKKAKRKPKSPSPSLPASSSQPASSTSSSKKKKKASKKESKKEKKEEPKKEKKEKKGNAVREALEAKFTQWRQSDVQSALAAIEEVLSEIGEHPAAESTFPAARLHVLIALLPENLRPEEGGPGEEALSGTDAKNFVQRLRHTAKAADDFYRGQQAAGAASAS